MDLSGLAKKLQQHAEKAKIAAKNFNFDDMAAQDDYIHSDSLNVKRREHEQSQGNSGNRRFWPLAGDGVAAHAPSHSEFDSPQQSAGFQHANTIPPLLSVVHDAMQSHTHHSGSTGSCKRVEELPPARIDSDSESDDDDPIMRQISRQRTPTQMPEKKQRNRFMDDLEEHVSKENRQLLHAVHTRVENDNVDRPGSWISGLLGRRKPLYDAGTELAPLARKKKSEARGDIEEGVDVIVASTNVLRPEELAQLRMLKSATPGWSESCTIILREHPREAFICFTLLLCIFVYLHGRLVIDDVH